jgi:hypothetical protein
LKKFIAVIVGMMLVLGLAGVALAVHAEIPAETQAVVAKGATQVYISGNLRIRGWFKSDISGRNPADNVTNTAYYDQRVRLKVDAKLGGVTGRIHLHGWTVDGQWGRFNAVPDSDLAVLEAWIDYKGEGLGFPAGIKVGHMPLVLGPAKLFFDHRKFGDDAIVLYADPNEQTHIALLTIKAAEVLKGEDDDDTDIYVGLLNYKLDAHTVGAYYAYVASSGTDTKFSDLGLHAQGEVAGVNYTAQVDLQFGDLDATQEASGWAVWLQGAYKLEPATVRALFAYGSGDDNTDNDVEEFVTVLSGVKYYTVVYDYMINSASGYGDLLDSTADEGRNGIANTMVIGLGVDLKPLEKLGLALDAYYLRAAETTGGIDEDIGIEFDVKATYKLAKNLKYYVWAGYLSTGDFYEDQGIDGDPLVLMHALELAF